MRDYSCNYIYQMCDHFKNCTNEGFDVQGLRIIIYQIKLRLNTPGFLGFFLGVCVMLQTPSVDLSLIFHRIVVLCVLIAGKIHVHQIN